MTSDNAKDSKVGQTAARLISGLKLTSWLPFFDRGSIRDVISEMGELFKHLHHNLDQNRLLSSLSISSNEPRAVAITFLDTALRRNRQCVLAYLNYRQEKIRDLLWEHVGLNDKIPEKIRERLDQDEERFFRNYSAVLRRYSDDVNGVFEGSSRTEFVFDITLDHDPPKSIAVEIELLQGSEGSRGGTRILARRSVAEPLILQGLAKHLNSEQRQGFQRL